MTKSYTLSEEEIKVLDILNDNIHLSTDPHISFAVYRSIAQSLRDEAEKIEKEDYAIGMFRRLMSRIHVATPASDEDGSSWPPSEPTGRRGDPG